MFSTAGRRYAWHWFIRAFVATAFLQCELPAGADEADDLYAAAAANYAQARWRIAAEGFQDFLQKYPSHAEAVPSTFYLAEALLLTEQYAEAGRQYGAYLDRAPAGKYALSARFRIGEAAHFSGDTARAKSDLEAFLAKHPKHKLHAYVLPYLGEIALEMQDWTKAADYFRDGLAQFPEGSMQDDCRLGLGRVLKHQKDYAKAEQFFRTVAETPGSVLRGDACYELGALQYSQGRFENAVTTFEAFEKSPLDDSSWQADARLGRGWSLVKLDRLDEATAVFRQLSTDSRLGSEAQFWLGSVQRLQENWGVAAQTFLAAAKIELNAGRLPRIRYFAGDCFRRSGELVAAGEHFDWIINSGPVDGEWVDDAMLGNARAALERKNDLAVDRVVSEFRQRYPNSPLQKDMDRVAAESLLQRNEFAKALVLLEPLAVGGVLDQQGMNDRLCLAEVYHGLERYNDGLAVLLPVLDAAKGPVLTKAQLTRASLLVGMEKYADALKPLEEYLAGDPTEEGLIRARGQLAHCYARTRYFAKAKQTYGELDREHAGDVLLPEITRQLAEAALAAADALGSKPESQQWAKWSTELFQQIRTDAGDEVDEWTGLYGEAWSQRSARQLEQAAATFDTLLRKKPPVELAASAACARGAILEELDQKYGALDMYKLVLDEYPDSQQHPNALLAAARLSSELAQNDESSKRYERFANLYPTHASIDTALYQWAWVLEDLGRTTEATALFERIRKEHPKSSYSADAKFRLAQRALADRDYEQANRLVTDVLTTDRDNRIRQHAIDLRGRIAVAQEDWPTAGATYALLLNEYSDSPQRLVFEYWVAESAYRQKKHTAAREAFDKLAPQILGRKDAWLAMIPLRRAQLAAHADDWVEAKKIALTIEAGFPDFQQQYEVDYVLGRCLAGQADFENAREAYRRVIRSPRGEKTETAAMAQLMIAESFFFQKDYDEALKAYLQVHSLYAFPYWQAAGLLQAGTCLDRLDRLDEADTMYEQLIEEFPDTDFAKDARQRLADPPTQRSEDGQIP